MVLASQLTYAGVSFVLDEAKIVRFPGPRPNVVQPEMPPALRQQPAANLIDELNRLIPFQYTQEFALPSDFPGRDVSALARREFRGPYPCPEIKINDFYYPTTATRWSMFRGLATSTQVKEMLFKTQGGAPDRFIMRADPLGTNMQRLGDNAVSDLVGAQVQGEQYTLSTEMYLLPPRPLAEHGGRFDGLYLVTLVDERYWWQYVPATLKITRGSTWNSVIGELVELLDVSIDAMNIPAVYGCPEPDSHLWTGSANAAVLLDAVAFNLGTVVVRFLDGHYRLITSHESQAFVLDSRGQEQNVRRTAGGEIFYSGSVLPVGSLFKARNTVIPDIVEVSFPKYVAGDDPVPHFANPRYEAPRASVWYEEGFGAFYNAAVPLASGNFISNSGSELLLDTAPVSGLSGVTGFLHSIHTTAKALYSGEAALPSGTPLNSSGLTALAMRLASDYWSWQTLTALDEVYPGTYAWTPEGFHDLIWTFSARSRQAVTRVLRTQWNQMVCEMQHATPPPSGFASIQTSGESSGLPDSPYFPKGIGGPSVAQSWRDSRLDVPETFLASALVSGAFEAIFESVAFFPTQNNWRGRINNEILYFNGTSGGIAVNSDYRVTILHRGIDGTLMPLQHDADSTVTHLTPDVSYGVNLVTHEKGKFLYPAEWTSGGIQGVNVVPETQTVRVLDGSGTSLAGVQVYSGILQTYAYVPRIWVNNEDVWILERNGNAVFSGQRYDGQMIGYSASGKVAPLYAINQDIRSSGQSGGGSDVFIGARVFNQNPKTVGGLITDLNWDAAAFDTGAFHQAGSARFVIGQTGYYALGAQVTWFGSDVGTRTMNIRVGSDTNPGHLGGGASDFTAAVAGVTSQVQSTSSIFFLLVNDYVAVQLLQDSGVDLDIIAGEANSNFWIHFLGPLAGA